MGKGGPMAFLNKKTWHPGRVQNMEEVWKREQVASKEEQKVRDLQKQIAEERAREELHSMAQAAGVKVRNDRLDWMYQGGVMAKKEADSRVATQGVGSSDDPGAQASSQGEPAQDAAPVSLPAFYSNDTPASANEMWQRLHADPLFAIKHQEQSARRSILANPVQMQAIKAQIGGHGGGGSQAHRDAASAQAQGTRYGLNYLRQEVEDEERSARAEATQRHLAEAARRREEEERAAAATRGQRATYRPGRLSAEEQAARLSAMAHAAEAHEDERVVRVRSQTVREAAEEREAGLRAAGTTASFLESAQKGVYGAEGGLGASGNGSLAEAVNRRKHFNQRGSAAGGAAFRR
ncbi:Pre-mRNA-splicing factor CWC25 [Auxenochlorella protothecoides]|uniref:Pre-mRNA-splicing factor CWC25 n=1 Tax=Auxenochlorella protothecoides TaxID=3075 RepID=A0A087SBV9_AUXPR|nr:Pre-mRNA-splicing factor CWC25 [Auxenochlorella protothecoides]KFM23213.1 Pre-mRNA-splicing factor CWC25 [Auxenochlorella protothecoides]